MSGILINPYRYITSSNTYDTWNPSDKNANITLSNGNLTATRAVSAGAHALCRSTQGKSSGKWYFEIVYVVAEAAQGDWSVGFTAAGDPTNTYPGSATVNAQSTGYFPTWAVDARKYKGGTGTDLTGYGRITTTGQYVQIAVDLTNGNVWYKNSNVSGWAGGGNPATGTSPTFTFTGGTTLYPTIEQYDDPVSCTVNFGASAFSGSVPSGFNSGWYT